MNSRNGLGMAVGIAIGTTILVSTLIAGPKRAPTPKPEDVKLVGQIVDLQTYMTEKCNGNDLAKCSDADLTKCTLNGIRAGVPTAIVTDEDGVIIIGSGDKGPARLLLPLAYKTVEAQGKLYDKDGVLYLDLTTAKVFKEGGDAAPQGGDGSGEP